MLPRAFLLYLLSQISTSAAHVGWQNRGYFQWGNEPVRGVNLGGWLVLEPWITPSLFENKPDWVVDEWSYGVYSRRQGNTFGEIQDHWNTWFRKSDLEMMKRVGLNTVRVPIGYWSLIPLETGEPYLPGAFDYLKLGVNWAQQVGLNVMIDLHGAPGSQNGFDNSGFRGPREWFWNQTNADRAISALRVLVTEFTQPSYANTVTAIGLLNEPFPQNADQVGYLRAFYQAAYSEMRRVQTQQHLVLVLDAAYQGLPAWHDFMTGPGYYDVGIDTHSYSMFNNYTLVYGYNTGLDWFCNQTDYFRASNNRHWTIIGEFTPSHTDCARWLNGRGRGARWDNSLSGAYPLTFPGNCQDKTGKYSPKWNSDYINFLGRSFETQTYVYEQASGWIMWTWKTEEAADWSMSDGIIYGFIPNPVWNRTRGQACARTVASISHAETGYLTRGEGLEEGRAIIAGTLGISYIVAYLFQ